MSSLKKDVLTLPSNQQSITRRNIKLMEKMTKEQRHRCMSAIHSRNTKPEMIVRRYLFSHGFRYRLNHPRLPGHPDIVMRKYRTVIFVNGCFWHGHENCNRFVMPKTNSKFWQSKIERNKNRDLAQRKQLAAMGWHTITVWECQLTPTAREETLASLEYTLHHIYLGNQAKQYEIKETSLHNVAEE